MALSVHQSRSSRTMRADSPRPAPLLWAVIDARSPEALLLQPPTKGPSFFRAGAHTDFMYLWSLGDPQKYQESRQLVEDYLTSKPYSAYPFIIAYSNLCAAEEEAKDRLGHGHLEVRIIQIEGSLACNSTYCRRLEPLCSELNVQVEIEGRLRSAWVICKEIDPRALVKIIYMGTNVFELREWLTKPS